jgi:hypothetical protein
MLKGFKPKKKKYVGGTLATGAAAPAAAAVAPADGAHGGGAAVVSRFLVTRSVWIVSAVAAGITAWALAAGAHRIAVDAGVSCVCALATGFAPARAGPLAMAAMAAVGVVSSAVETSFTAVSMEAQTRALAVLMAFPVGVDVEPRLFAWGAGAAVAVCVAVQAAVRLAAPSALGSAAACIGGGAVCGIFVAVLAWFAGGAHRALRGRAAAAAATAAAQVQPLCAAARARARA